MSEAILTLNAGSSSLKFSIYPLKAARAGGAAAFKGQISSIGADAKFEIEGTSEAGALSAGSSHAAALAELVPLLKDRLKGLELVGAGHRIVHGGADFHAPVRLTLDVLQKLDTFCPLAPSHQPHNLAGVDAVTQVWPSLPQFGSFDTAFHRTQAPIAERYALPRRLTDEGIIRYGFHGLSYAHIAQVAPDYLGDTATGRVIVAHLGHGASLCAMKDRKSVATSMGFTALDGLPMAKRSGALDPGVVLYLLQEKGLSPDEVAHVLYKESGLFGVSGVSDDMRDLLASADPNAAEAVDLFCYRTAREIGSLAAALGGLDALIFTAGIGEHAAPVRAKILHHCAWLGIDLDATANDQNQHRLTTPDSRVSAWMIPTDEEAEIARDTAECLKGAT